MFQKVHARIDSVLVFSHELLDLGEIDVSVFNFFSIQLTMHDLFQFYILFDATFC